MADQSERHPSTKSSDTVSKHDLENIDPGGDETVTDEEAEFVRNMGLTETVNSTTKADAATNLESTDPIDSNNGIDTNSAEDELLSAVDGDGSVQSDDGNDLLATSNYPEGTTHPGPEDSADLFDSLAVDERKNTQVPDSQPSVKDEEAWFADDEIEINLSKSDQSNIDMDDHTDQQEHTRQAVGQSIEEHIEKIAQNFDQESAAEITGHRDLLAANHDHDLADDEVNATLDFGENSKLSDSVRIAPTELGDSSTSTSQDSTDDLEDASEPLRDSLSRQAVVAEPYGSVIDSSTYSNQGAESDDVHNVSDQYTRGETTQEIPAVGSESSHKTSIDIGDRSVQSDASNAGAHVLTYDNMLEEGNEMRWFTIGMPILLVTVIIIMGGYVYSLQSQIDEIQVLLSSEEEDFFDDEQSNGSVLLNESTLAHVNARIDNLADSVEAIANRTLDQTGDPSGAAGRDGMNSINRDLAILADRVHILEDKVPARPVLLRKASKAQTGDSAKPKPSTPKKVKKVKTGKLDKTVSSVEPKSPVIRSKSGVWAVNLMSVTEKVDAERQLKGFRDKGVAAVIQPKTISGKQWYRIQVAGFDSKQKAKDYAASVKAKLGLASVWVTR